MKFKSTQELLEFFNKLDLEESTLVFKKEESASSCSCGGGETVVESKVPTASSKAKIVLDAKSAILEGLSDRPSYPLEFGDLNVLKVRDYKAVPNACGTGKITLENREFFINMCEENGHAKIDMSIQVEDHHFRNVTFLLEKTTGPVTVVLSNSYFMDDTNS
jgi:hypothetical protein